MKTSKLIYGLFLIVVFVIVSIAVWSAWKEIPGEDTVGTPIFGVFCGAIVTVAVNWIVSKLVKQNR